jgi:putative tricarboxylic transport membrane protein
MKRGLFLVLLVLAAAGAFATGSAETSAAFPAKPIHLVVYTAPGGLIDITARKFTDIAAKYTKATFVVENKAGAGGMVGWEAVLAQPADGYTLFAVTRSLVTNLVSTGSKIDPFSLDWMAMLVNDPECLITGVKSKVRTGAEILADAKARPGQQIWTAPPGVDEFVTYKIWDKIGVSEKYVTFDCGAQAMAVVIGGQAEVYVGNPADVAGKPDLQIAVISAPKRLPQFPDVPTFKELGIKELDNETMWRGFALKAGTSAKIKKWYDDLFDKVTDDPDWHNFFEPNGMTLVHVRTDKFDDMVRKDIAEQTKYLKK